MPYAQYSLKCRQLFVDMVALKHNGQRWHALAVQDYESRALPL